MHINSEIHIYFWLFHTFKLFYHYKDIPTQDLVRLFSYKWMFSLVLTLTKERFLLNGNATMLTRPLAINPLLWSNGHISVVTIDMFTAAKYC